MGQKETGSAKPKVSICLTTYKRASVLPLSIESILNQSFTDFELIISDDCSPDDTESLCLSYLTRDSRVRYSRNAHNLKMPGNLNVAISQARGEYIANLHDGDVYRPDLIEKWAGALDRYPMAAFVFNSLEALDDHRAHLRYYFHEYPPLIPGRRLLDEMLFMMDSPVFGTVMARHTAYDEVGPFDEEFGFISDVDMWMRLSLHHDVAYIREPLICVAPREKNHAYSFVNWELNSILDRLHRRNLSRRFVNEPAQCRIAVARFRRIRDAYWLRHWLVCIKHRRWDKATEGVEFFRVSDSPFLHATAKIGSLFLHFVRGEK